MRYKWNGKNKLGVFFTLLALLSFFSGCDDSPSKPGEGFYSYTGYRDWWRFPLKSPYHVMIIDTFSCGYIEKYDFTENIADPNVSSHSIVDEEINMIFPAKDYVAFHCKKGDFGILIYDSEKIMFFETETIMHEYIKETFSQKAPIKLQSLEQSYNDIWNSLSNKEIQHK